MSASNVESATYGRDVRTAGVIGVGYEGRTAEEVVVGLVADGVATVVDVRLTPVSRKRGLSKRGLAAALGEAGIAYEHLPALGNPRDNRAAFAELDTDAGRRARECYAALLRAPAAQDALQSIRALARSGRVALLCFEAEEQRCHRGLVLAALRD